SLPCVVVFVFELFDVVVAALDWSTLPLKQRLQYSTQTSIVLSWSVEASDCDFCSVSLELFDSWSCETLSPEPLPVLLPPPAVWSWVPDWSVPFVFCEPEVVAQ